MTPLELSRPIFFSNTKSSACPARRQRGLKATTKKVNIKILIDVFGLVTEIKKSLNRKI